MSSDSDLSSLSEDEQPNSRLHSIWNSIKETKNISQLYRNHQQHDQSSHQQQQQSLHARGRDKKHREEQEQTQKSRENVAHLLRKLQESHQEKQDLKCELNKVRRENEEQINRLRKEYENKIRAQRRKTKTNQKENNYDNKEQKFKIESLTKEIQRLTLRIKSLQFQKKTRDAENERITESNELYLRKLSEGQQKIGSEILQLKGRGEQLLELSEANRTIQRLVQLLKKTEQYRQFSPLMSDIKNLHFLKNIPKRMKSNQLNVKPANKGICSCCIKIGEKMLWSPTQCYRTMLEMKLKYDYLSEDCIEEVLFQINKIYSSREERNLRRVREHYQVEMGKLRKKIEENYDQLLAKKQINRLKKELRVFKSVQKSKAQPKIDSLKNKGQYEDQLKLKDRQIRLLHERIKLFQTQNGFYDKSLYFQGALWIIDKILSQVQANEGSLKQFQVNFRERIDQNMQTQDWLRSYKQFFQTLTELNSQLVERLFTIKDSTLKKMSVSSKMQQV